MKLRNATQKLIDFLTTNSVKIQSITPRTDDKDAEVIVNDDVKIHVCDFKDYGHTSYTVLIRDPAYPKTFLSEDDFKLNMKLLTKIQFKQIS
jgi:hypothetical protein